MLAQLHSAALFVLAATEGGGGEEDSGSFLVSPSVGLMIWTLIAFGATLLLLRKFAFPRIQAALDRRANAIEESIEHAQRTPAEADAPLAEYRERRPAPRGHAEQA